MRPNERTVSFYDLHIESKFFKHAAQPIPVPTAIALNIAREMKGASPFSRGNTQLKVTLADWQHSASLRRHYLVINRADASMPDIPLRDMRTDATRMAGKAISEGIDLTCHVLIQEGADPRDRCLMLMTSGSSLPVAKVAAMITRLFKNAEEVPAHAQHFLRDHPNGAGAKLRVHSQFEVSGHQNALLSQILRGGGVEGIDLISDADEMLDEESRLMITSTMYQLVPMNQSKLSLTRLLNAIKKAPREIEKARVRYKAPGRSKTESHTFDVGDLDSAFVRKDTVRFDDPIQPRYERVNMAIMQKLSLLIPHAKP